MKTCMVKIPEMRAFLLVEGTTPDPSLGLEVVEGGWIEIPPGVFDQPEGAEYRPQNLGVCRSDPRHFRSFRHPEEVEAAGFESTGLSYGGAYSAAMWERFVARLPSIRAWYAIPDDPPEVMKAVLHDLGEVR